MRYTIIIIFYLFYIISMFRKISVYSTLCFIFIVSYFFAFWVMPNFSKDFSFRQYININFYSGNLTGYERLRKKEVLPLDGVHWALQIDSPILASANDAGFSVKTPIRLTVPVLSSTDIIKLDDLQKHLTFLIETRGGRFIKNIAVESVVKGTDHYIYNATLESDYSYKSAYVGEYKAFVCVDDTVVPNVHASFFIDPNLSLPDKQKSSWYFTKNTIPADGYSLWNLYFTPRDRYGFVQKRLEKKLEVTLKDANGHVVDVTKYSLQGPIYDTKRALYHIALALKAPGHYMVTLFYKKSHGELIAIEKFKAVFTVPDIDKHSSYLICVFNNIATTKATKIHFAAFDKKMHPIFYDDKDVKFCVKTCNNDFVAMLPVVHHTSFTSSEEENVYDAAFEGALARIKHQTGLYKIMPVLYGKTLSDFVQYIVIDPNLSPVDKKQSLLKIMPYTNGSYTYKISFLPKDRFGFFQNNILNKLHYAIFDKNNKEVSEQMVQATKLEHPKKNGPYTALLQYRKSGIYKVVISYEDSPMHFQSLLSAYMKIG